MSALLAPNQICVAQGRSYRQTYTHFIPLQVGVPAKPYKGETKIKTKQVQETANRNTTTVLKPTASSLRLCTLSKNPTTCWGVLKQKMDIQLQVLRGACAGMRTYNSVKFHAQIHISPNGVSGLSDGNEKNPDTSDLPYLSIAFIRPSSFML